MKRPPIVSIQGGLGNQLFQWFYAHHISRNSEFSLHPKIPVGPVAQVVYALELSPLFTRCSHYREIPQGSRNPFKNDLLPRVFDYFWSVPALTSTLKYFGYFRENPRSKTRAHNSPPKRIRYANGYFQNWQYADSQREAINTEMIPILDETFRTVQKRFDLVQPYTVVHVRRGDYRTDQNPETMIGSLSDEYFIQWCKANPSSRLVLLAEHKADVEDLISAIHPTLVLDNKSTTPWETLAIMHGADTLLGSNSTLSWWGAWTASMRGAITFLPSSWDIMERFNTPDFLFPGCRVHAASWEKF